VAHDLSSPGTRLRGLWARLSPLPGGSRVFSRLLALMVPYSATVGAQVVALEPGHVRLVLRDRRRIRNHLGSVHAVALVNAGELASGLALLTGLPPHARGIVTGLSAEYHRKARGRLTVASTAALPEISGDVDHEVTAVVTDADGEDVATVRVRWRLGLKPGHAPPPPQTP
jgi:acyl-coenzyme A thioesterase PaaI-like protein